MSAVDLLLPRCSLPTGHRCGHGSRACRFERLTLPEKTGLAAVPGVLIYKDFFRLIRVTLANNILKNHSHKNKRAGIAAGLATPPVVLPAQKKPRTKAGFDGLPAPLTGAANVGQELTKPCPGDMSMINYLHNTGSVHDMHLSDAVTSADRASRWTSLLPRPAAGLHALRGRS